MTLKKTLDKKISIPQGVSVEITPTLINVKGKSEVSRRIGSKMFTIKVEDNTVILAPKKKHTRKEKALINSTASHIQNMIQGVNEPFIYKLKICSSHFPMKVVLKGKVLEISNFMGEKSTRRTTVKDGVDIKLEGDIITLSSPNKELAGQVATDIEKLTKRPAFDRRVFMDGVYLTEKAGVHIE